MHLRRRTVTVQNRAGTTCAFGALAIVVPEPEAHSHSLCAIYITEETTHTNQDQQYNNQCCEYRLSALYPGTDKLKGDLTIDCVNNVEPTNAIGRILLEGDEAVQVWVILSKEADDLSPM